VRHATGTFSRKRLQGASIEGAPYEPGDVVCGRYEIRDAVGAGPVGIVFRAHDREIDIEVALKVVNARLVQTAEERKQFSRPMRLARKLSHQNLIRVYEEGEDQDRPFYTMQFLEGLTLRKIIDLRVGKGEFFRLGEIEPILGQVANALDAAHKLGPHGNLKPENVIVLPDLLKVGDFGLSLSIPRLPFVQAVRQHKADGYLAPEYVQGGEVDQRADIYALGVIVGEMLSGLTPDGSVPELIRRNPEVPPALEGLYRRATNSNPLARPKTASEFFDEFADIARRVSPPPLRSKPELAAVPAVPRTRSPGTAPTVELRKRNVDKPAPAVPQSDGPGIPSDLTQPVPSNLVPPPPPPDASSDETMLLPSFVAPDAPPPEEPRIVTEPGPVPARSRVGPLLFALFTVAGLGLGAAGGYWLLGRTRPTAAPRQLVVTPAPKAAPENVPGPVISAETPTTSLAPDAGLAEEARPAEEARRAEEARAAEEARRKAEAQREAEAQRQAAARREAEEARAEEEKRRAAEAAKRSTAQPAAAIAPVGPEKAECPDGMRLVQAGAFRMGTSRDDPMMGFDEKLLRKVTVGAFCMDIYEYPNRRGASPKVNVSWTEAARLCEARGRRLCTEEEWEKACKGPGNQRYPYGNTFDASSCNTEDELGEDRALASSGRFGKCRSGYGIADLSGNVAEWTASSFAANADRTRKGGSFALPDHAGRCSARKNGAPGARDNDVGFRCCADAP
jgi:eukaryotic-like serine/threonine-protein kinase